MTTLNKEIYVAFQATGIDDAKAKAAAEAGAWYDELIHGVKAELAHIGQELAGTNGKLTVLIALKVAMVLAAIGPNLGKLFA